MKCYACGIEPDGLLFRDEDFFKHGDNLICVECVTTASYDVVDKHSKNKKKTMHKVDEE